MKPSQQLAAMAVAGLCGTAFSLPQVPYYTSRFPQHPQNLGYGGDYPKYWQGEAYSPPQEAPSYYNPNNSGTEGPSAPAEARPSFTDRKYPAREAIKYYGGSNFPVSEEETSDEPDSNVRNVKIKNDNPAGDNDKTFTRITKSSSPGGIGKKKKTATEESPVKKSGGLESIADAAIPEFNGAAEVAENRKEQENTEPENWNSFAFGVVSDSLDYHDPYENREGDFERKTNAMDKIERMMGHDYSKTKNSLNKRDWPDHIQEKALKMMDSASNMQTKGQKTIDNDPTYQESLKAKNPAPAPEQAAEKSPFPAGPKSKNPQQAPKQAPQAPPPQQKKKSVGSGGGDLVPPEKSGKLGKAKGKAPPPQQQGPSSQPGQPQQPRQPPHNQPNQQPKGDMARKTGNSKQPQQGNFPSQDLPSKGSKGSGLNKRPQNSQKQPQNAQKKPQSKNKPQQQPQSNLRKRQVAVPAGPNYPPGTTIIRRPYVAPQAAAPVQNYQPVGAPPIRQIFDGQLQNQHQGHPVQQISDGQIQRHYLQPVPAPVQRIIPAPAPAPVPAPVQYIQPGQPAQPVEHVKSTQYIQPTHYIQPGQPVEHVQPVQYVQPTQYIQPGQLVQPVQHVQPAQSVQHVQPAQPVQHNHLVQHAQPVQHNQPVQSVEHTQPVQPVQPMQSVQHAHKAERVESVQYATIVHPGQVICPENKPCPQREQEYEYREKTVLQPVQRVKEVEVIREGVKAVPKLEAVDVVSYVDVVKEKEVEKQVLREHNCACGENCACENCACEEVGPKTITVCAGCRETPGECTCNEGGRDGRDGESYSHTFSNGKEATAYNGRSPFSGPSGPISGPGGLEAFFRQKMPEQFEH